MDTNLRCSWKSVKHLRRSVWRKYLATKNNLNYFRKTLHLKCLTRFWIRNCQGWYSRKFLVVWESKKKTPKILISKRGLVIPLQYIYSLRKTFWNNSFSAFVVKLNKKTSWDFCKKPSWDFCYWRPRLILSLKSCVVWNFNFAVYHSRECLTLFISTETGSASYNGASHP